RPDLTTTRGTGELLAAALRHGAARLLLTLGGSATHDGGTGAAAALGWRFLDAGGRDLPPGGAALCRLARIVPPPKGRPAVPVEALCDVDNPLTGPRGAAAVYAPQKGASPEMVRVLEEALQRLAERWRADLGLDLEAMPGAGAAGGFGAGAVAFLGARLTPGVEAVAAVNGLPVRLRQVDWVLTGEGRFDEQSLQGKVVSGVLRHAAAAGTRVAVVAGSVALPPERWRAAGVAAVEACAPAGITLAEAMRRAPELLQAAVARLAERSARQAG
ncbi:MAG: glycerate kinase, partial [Lentisphaerae bacterium]|nr:glycerate kinase [Lentisphaerota bacterium]